MDLYIQVHARRHLPSSVPWISEDLQLYCHCLQVERALGQLRTIQPRGSPQSNEHRRGIKSQVKIRFSDAPLHTCLKRTGFRLFFLNLHKCGLSSKWEPNSFLRLRSKGSLREAGAGKVALRVSPGLCVAGFG